MCKIKKKTITYNLYENGVLIKESPALKAINHFIKMHEIKNFEIEEMSRNGELIKRIC